MERKNINKSVKKGIKGKAEKDLPFCMKAPSAEHSRAHDYDEPCDDGRSGELDEK